MAGTELRWLRAHGGQPGGGGPGPLSPARGARALVILGERRPCSGVWGTVGSGLFSMWGVLRLHTGHPFCA